MQQLLLMGIRCVHLFFLSLIILCLTLLISYIARKKKNEITYLIFRMLAHNDIANCFEIIKVRRIYYVNQ